MAKYTSEHRRSNIVLNTLPVIDLALIFLLKYLRDSLIRIIKNLICGLQLPREPHQSTRLLQPTDRWQYDRRAKEITDKWL